MIRAVLDTNVLASAAIAHPGTTLATILDSIVANRFELAVSEHILVELRRTLASPYYAARITPAAAGRYVQLLRFSHQDQPYADDQRRHRCRSGPCGSRGAECRVPRGGTRAEES
jgi:predicted nucleic acid-binding protein